MTTENLNPNNRESISQEAETRKQLALSAQKLAELRERGEMTDNRQLQIPGKSEGSREAARIIISNVPGITQIVDLTSKSPAPGNLKKDGSAFIARVDEMPIGLVEETQFGVDRLLRVVVDVQSYPVARRIDPYLPVLLPETRNGFNGLLYMAKEYNEEIPLPGLAETENIALLVESLDALDVGLKSAALSNNEVVNILAIEARQQAQIKLDKLKIDGSEQISQIRAEIAQQRISALKREPMDIPGTHGYSRYEVLANEIIEKEDLSTQADSAREEAESRQRKEREIVLNAIARKRAISTVAAQIDQDPLLCQVLAQRSRLNPEDLGAADQELKKRIAEKALSVRGRIVLSAENQRVFIGERVVEAEKAKLTQSLLDPLSFISRLSDDELSVIRNGISKISDERSVFELAGNRLRKQLEDKVTDDEIIAALTKTVLADTLSARIPGAVDSAIIELGIDRDSVLKDPTQLGSLKDEIIARGLEILVSDSQIATSTKKAQAIPEDERRKQREAALSIIRAQDLSRIASTSEARILLDQSIEAPVTASLGNAALRTDIKSTLGPFEIYPEYKTTYPPVVLQALGNLYAEYNQAFRSLVAANREYATDYQYCLTPDGTPINSFVQIDMVGLPARFLEQAATLSEEDVREALRGRIFEIENSIAMYSLLEYFFSNGTADTLFNRQFRAGLDNIRQRYGRPIALLAVTDQKYQAMRETEFGKRDGEPLTDEEVREYSGFDKFFSPEQFRRYIEENGGNSNYLLYVRSSDPVAKMKRPDLLVDEELLADDEMRRIIKANSLTFNIDRPDLPIGDSRRINDTKEYLPTMGMAFPVYYGEDLTSEEFDSYLRSQGVDPSRVRSGELLLRAKPMKGTYGGYGHFRGTLGDARFRRDLRDALLKRGSYVVQPELQNPTITNQDDGRTFMYIDRVFFSTDGQNYQFMGGERTLMPIGSNEAENNRVHGNKSSVYAEIV